MVILTWFESNSRFEIIGDLMSIYKITEKFEFLKINYKISNAKGYISQPPDGLKRYWLDSDVEFKI